MDAFLIVSSILLWMIVLFNLVLGLALVRRVNKLSQINKIEPPDMLKVGEKAPNFTAETLDGRTVTLADYGERDLALVFISPGCGPCSEQMPKLNALYPKARKAGVELAVVSLANVAETQTYVSKLEFTAPVLTAPRDVNKLNDEYKVPGTPSYYLLDQQGKIKSAGFLDSQWEEITQQWN